MRIKMKKNKIIYAAAITGMAAASIYGINKTINIIANTKSTLANPNGLQYKWRLGNIFYTKQGTGKPVLLIHDLTCGSSSAEWKFIASQYAKTHTVYTLDLIGCGKSDKPPVTYTNYMYVQLITDFIKNIINHRTDVVATGYSSSFVLMSCFSDSTLFDKIVLINPDNIIKGKMISGNQKIIKKLIELPIIGTTIYNLANTKKSYYKMFKDYYCHNFSLIRRNVVRTYYEASHYGSMTSKYLFASIISNYTGINVTNAVKNINNSIFIIGSEHEPDIRQKIKAYTELNSSIECAIINEAKHLPQLEKPGELLAQIEIFLS